jgi:hypothetical protein
MSEEMDPLQPRFVEASGPWHRPGWEFSVGGFRVPYVQAALVEGEEKRWVLDLDRRFMLEVDDEEVQRWMPFLAHAMAIAAGYSCHGEGCTLLNPFSVRVTGLDGVDETR